MGNFYNPRDVVYILENRRAQRVKVGITSNRIEDRLSEINDLWQGRKVTCPICGGRLLNVRGYVPLHVKSAIRCPGSGELPLEKDVTHAESYLENLKRNRNDFTGNEKASITRKINTLEKRIELYRNYTRPVGIWEVRLTFYTANVEKVESLSHQFLSESIDKGAPFGEVFCCTVDEATQAVESALTELGLLQGVRKVTKPSYYD